MSEESEYFRVKRDYVHITKDALKIWNDPNLSGFTENNGMARVMFGILARFAFMTYLIYKYLIVDTQILASRPYSLVFIGILAVVYIAQTIYTLQFSYTNNIPRTSIHSIKYNKGLSFLITSHLIVYFEKNGKQRKRLIVFSGFMGDPKDKQNGLRKLRDAGLYNPGANDEDLLDVI